MGCHAKPESLGVRPTITFEVVCEFSNFATGLRSFGKDTIVGPRLVPGVRSSFAGPNNACGPVQVDFAHVESSVLNGFQSRRASIANIRFLKKKADTIVR